MFVLGILILSVVIFTVLSQINNRPSESYNYNERAEKMIQTISVKSYPDCGDIVMNQFRRMDIHAEQYKRFGSNCSFVADAMLMDSIVYLLEYGEYTISSSMMTGEGAQLKAMAENLNIELLKEGAIAATQYDALNAIIKEACRPAIFRHLF